MTKKIISLCPHLQRFQKKGRGITCSNEAPIGLEDVLFAIEANGEDMMVARLTPEAVALVSEWNLKTDYRKQPREVKELVKSILR